MKKIIRLTESELKNIVEASVRRAIKEGAVDESWKSTVAGGLGGAALMTGLAGAGAFDNDPLFNDTPGAYQEDVEFLKNNGELPDNDAVPGNEELPSDTIGWEEANRIPENRIRRAVMESIKKLMKNQG